MKRGIKKLQGELLKELQAMRNMQKETQDIMRLKQQIELLSTSNKNLQDQVKNLSDTHHHIDFQSGVINIEIESDSHSSDDTSQCIDDADNDHRQLNGRVTFASPFQTKPVVAVGLTAIDATVKSNDSVRINLEIISVDTDGFNYVVNVQRNTDINAGSVSWMAIGK